MDRFQPKQVARPMRAQLKSTTVLPLVLGLGVAGFGFGFALCHVRPARANPAVLPGTLNPEALPRRVQSVACNPCNPCAAGNPCGAAANPCNPCAAVNPCNPCNPCAAAAAGATDCMVPRLQTAALSPCNPCAAANPCNPCAAKNPCNPCAAANPCNPCNPCAAGEVVELTDAEAASVYDCVNGYQQAAYGVSDNPDASAFWGWPNYSLIPYLSATHGNRYVMNYSNAPAYGQYEDAGELSVGAKIAKNSFVVGTNGQVSVGPLFLMEKMPAGFDENGGDWRYTMIMPDGSTFGVTGGQNAAGMEFCNACHGLVGEDQDYLYFLPEDYRTAKN